MDWVHVTWKRTLWWACERRGINELLYQVLKKRRYSVELFETKRILIIVKRSGDFYDTKKIPEPKRWSTEVWHVRTRMGWRKREREREGESESTWGTSLWKCCCHASATPGRNAVVGIHSLHRDPPTQPHPPFSAQHTKLPHCIQQ
jgi:hypothetical protein